jgi:anthranilate synthase/aminodeoxychorismate synthase-like glutamine amidotransferase
MRLLFVDNFDSFTYNVVHLLASQGAQLDVVLNDDPGLVPDALARYDGVVIGPGPGRPSDTPAMMAIVRAAVDRGTPLLGVCLGLQAIGEALGARVGHAPQLMHGKVSAIQHDGTGIFAGVPAPLQATRYHSLCLEAGTLPEDLAVVARSEDGVIQGIAHRHRPVHGVQFHPESVLSEHGDALIRNFLSLAKPGASD